MVQKLVISKKTVKVAKLSVQDDIITVKERKRALIGNKMTSSLEISLFQRELEAQKLKVVNIQIKKCIEKENYLLSDIDGE